jgi:hypothetical protein
MKKQMLTIATLILGIGAFAQTTKIATFEDLNLPPDTFKNGSERPAQNNFYISNNLSLNNFYDTSFGGYWSSGFAISTKTDSVTEGFTNLYSCITPSGNNQSATYAVGKPGGVIKQHTFSTGSNKKTLFNYVYVNNSAYAYYSMLNGDFFAKKFGGNTGNDSDWFLLKIVGYKSEVVDTTTIINTDTVFFYLADYRFADNSRDYIVKNWTKVDLTGLGRVDSISFFLSSSDVGAYGMNTPAFFCIDDIEFVEPATTSIAKTDNLHINVYPNPATTIVYVETNAEIENILITNLQGSVVAESRFNSAVSLANLSEGIYLLHATTKNGTITKKIIKH